MARRDWYRRLVLEEDADFAQLPFLTRAVAAMCLKHADAKGRFRLRAGEHPAEAVTFKTGATRADRAALRHHIPLLIEHGYLRLDAGYLVVVELEGDDQSEPSSNPSASPPRSPRQPRHEVVDYDEVAAEDRDGFGGSNARNDSQRHPTKERRGEERRGEENPEADPDVREAPEETPPDTKPSSVGTKPLPSSPPEPIQGPPTTAPGLLLPIGPEPSKPARGAPVVDEVLQHWAAQPYHGRAPKITEPRRKRVRERLAEGFSAEELKVAIDNVNLDDWLTGRDPKANGKKWVDVETILRDAAQVERLRDLQAAGEEPGDGLVRPPPRPEALPDPEIQRRVAAARAKGATYGTTEADVDAALANVGRPRLDDPRIPPLPHAPLKIPGGPPSPAIMVGGHRVLPNDCPPLFPEDDQ